MEKITVPRGTKKITVDQLELMHRMRKRGYTYDKIAKTFRISRTSCFNYLSGKAVPYTQSELEVLGK